VSDPVPPKFRKRFDALLERELESLPDHVLAVLDEVPLHVMDEPDRLILKDLGVEPDDMDDAVEELCGLHTGFMLTERAIELDAVLPTEIHLFRRGIALMAGGWNADDETVAEQIRITLLHEIGHHFGLEEDDLDELGYA
jgi:predicted Zn-dependent protease with MMP-like domain